MQVIEHEHVETTVKAARGRPDVRFDWLCRERRRQGTFNGQVHQREDRRRLRLAVFEYLEIVLGQVSDQIPALVSDDRVDFDKIDVGLERHSWLRGACGGWRLLRVADKPSRQNQNQQGHRDPCASLFNLLLQLRDSLQLFPRDGR